MSDNYLPSKENLSIFAGELFFQPEGEARARSMGHIDAFSWTPTVETEEIFAATSGVRTKIDELITEISVAISMTLKETTIANMAYAMQGDVRALVQAAQTASVITATDVKPGEMIDLGALSVENVVITDGTTELVSGVDYVLNTEAGVVIPYTAQATFEITYDAPEILDTDGRKVVEVLKNHSGITGTFHVIGKNQRGRRYAFRSFKATLRPSGDVQLLSDGSGLQQVELEGSGIENAALPLTPWGVLQALN